MQTKCSRQFWLNCQRKVLEQFGTRKLFYLRTYKNFTIIRFFHVTLQNPSKKGCSSSICFTFVIEEEKTFEMLQKMILNCVEMVRAWNMYQWKYRDKPKTTGVTIWLMITQKMDVCTKFQVGFIFYFDKKIIDKIEWHVVNVQETNSLWKRWKRNGNYAFIVRPVQTRDWHRKSQNNNKNCQFQVLLISSTCIKSLFCIHSQDACLDRCLSFVGFLCMSCFRH